MENIDIVLINPVIYQWIERRENLVAIFKFVGELVEKLKIPWLATKLVAGFSES